jgi:hypothetical protein
VVDQGGTEVAETIARPLVVRVQDWVVAKVGAKEVVDFLADKLGDVPAKYGEPPSGPKEFLIEKAKEMGWNWVKRKLGFP